MSRMKTITLAVLAALALPSTAALGDAGASGRGREFGAGEPGDVRKPARLVPVTMRETDDGKMVYFPARLDVRAGEQVRFKITNAGRTDHEFMLDTPEHNATHRAAMRKHPSMEHDDPNGVTVEPGKTAEIVWKFSKAGIFEYACLIPGHYESGMHADVAVR